MRVNRAQHATMEELIHGIYRNFETGDFVGAEHLLNKALSLDFENQEIQMAMRSCEFWKRRVHSLNDMSGHGARGNYLYYQWAVFEEQYQGKKEHLSKEGCLRLKLWVNREALNYYQAQSKESNDLESIFQAARCLKTLGRFEEAIDKFESILRDSAAQDVRCMAELADTYVLIGETKPGKALMREALFLDASRVVLDQLISPLFRQLITRMGKELPIDSPEFNEWLPVYGVLWAILDINRELSNVEYEKLKQRIYALKSEVADGDESGKLTPQLINCYFRLIDYYTLTNVDRSIIEKTLMNIKIFSPEFYNKYLK